MGREFEGREPQSVLTEMVGRQLTEQDMAEDVFHTVEEYREWKPLGPAWLYMTGKKFGVDVPRLLEGFGYPRFAAAVRRADRRKAIIAAQVYR